MYYRRLDRDIDANAYDAVSIQRLYKGPTVKSAADMRTFLQEGTEQVTAHWSADLPDYRWQWLNAAIVMACESTSCLRLETRTAARDVTDLTPLSLTHGRPQPTE